MNVTRYTEWYNQSTNDPFDGNYKNLFRLFDATVTPIDATGRDLLSSIASGQDTKTAFVMLNSDGRIHVVHRLRVLTAMLTAMTGESEAPHHHIVTAMLGDISASNLHFIEIPPTAFALTNTINVLTLAAIHSAIHSFPNAHQLAADPHSNVEAVRCRFYMLIPPNLTSRLLAAYISSSEGLTPRDLWLDFAEPLSNDDVLGRDCAPFIDWCRLAYAHGIGMDNPLCQELPPALPSDSALYRFRLKVLNWDIPLWEAEFKMEGVEHTTVRAGSGVTLPLSVDVDTMQVFFGDTEIVLPPLPDSGYLNEMMERVNHSGLVTRNKMLSEENLVALVQEASVNSSKDWRIRRAAKTANLPQEDFDNMTKCGEMFLQQTVFSPISELFSCFDVFMYCADMKVDCAHVVSCKKSIPTGKMYQVSCKPDSVLRLTENFYVGTMMEIKPNGTDEKSRKFDNYKCLLMTCMSACAIKEYLLAKNIDNESESHIEEIDVKKPSAKKTRLSYSITDERKPEYEEFAIPFVLAEHNRAKLFVTRLLKHSGFPVVSQLMNISFANKSNVEKKRKAEFMAMLSILVADIFAFLKKHDNMLDFFSYIRENSKVLPPHENALSRTKSSTVNEPKISSAHSKGPSHHTVNPSEREDAAMVVATWNGQVKNLNYPFPRTQTLCLDDSSDGQQYQWEVDMKFYQQDSPFYFEGTYHAIPVFCKVWREGDSRTNRQNINDEIKFHQKANMNGVPSTKVIPELTAMDILCGMSVHESSTAVMYHVLVAEFHRGSNVMECDIFKYAIELVKAVLSLHKIGVLHCDIKPGNILWDAQQKVVRLIDFGHAQDIMNAQSYPATQKYEAPEISEKYPHSIMSDAFAVGRTLEKVGKKFTSLDAEKIRVLAKLLQLDLSKRMSLDNASKFLTSLGNGKGSIEMICNLENVENWQSMALSF